ncbi:MAG: peptidase, partial [Clostridia bacterium]|nr:peptidase [Clostridia bacterium]
AVTGYLRVGGSGVVGGGYKDWAIDALEIPSLTIEVGSGDSPLEENELYSIFDRNYMVLPAVAKWLEG